MIDHGTTGGGHSRDEGSNGPPGTHHNRWKGLWEAALLFGAHLLAALAVVLLYFWMTGEIGGEPIPAQDEELHDDATRAWAAGTYETVATLNLQGGGLIEFRYGVTCDSGVLLRRMDRQGRSILWEHACPPLGVGHSEYHHEAFVSIEGPTLKVISRGSFGMFVERLDLATGRTLARSARKDGGL